MPKISRNKERRINSDNPSYVVPVGWKQMEYCLKMVKKPIQDVDRFERVLERVYALNGAYQ